MLLARILATLPHLALSDVFRPLAKQRLQKLEMKWNPFAKPKDSSARSGGQSASRQTAETSSSGGSRPRTRDSQGTSRNTPDEVLQASLRSAPPSTGLGSSEGDRRKALATLRQNGSKVTSACSFHRLGTKAFLGRLDTAMVRQPGEVWKRLENNERNAIRNTLAILSADPEPSVRNAAECLYTHLTQGNLSTIGTRHSEHLTAVVSGSTPTRTDARSVNSAETLRGELSPQLSQLSGDTLHP